MCMVLFPSGALRSGLSVVPAHRLYSIWALACLLTSAQGHGFMNIPRSRNAVAADEGRWWCSNNYCDNCPETEGKCPWPESCPQCLNRGGTVGLCGVVEGRDYLETKDMNGDPYQPQLQATYMQGGLLELEFLITAHHMGHVELHVCPNRDNPTQSCFDEHPLTFVEDLACAEPAPRDPNYPERGYLCPNNGDAEIPEGSYGDSRSGMGFRHHWRLPEGLHCEQCLLQWYYLTANSCNPPGYHDYPFPSSSWWKSALGDCSEIPGDGDGTPEQFWNCADIAITADGEPAPSSGVHQNIADLTCKTFYNCATGAGGLVTCPEGLLFSAPVVPALLAEWYRRFWRSGTGASSGVVPALLAQWYRRFWQSGTGASGGVEPALLAEWYRRFWPIPALLAECYWRFWRSGTGASGRVVLALLAEWYRRFWRSGTGASGRVVLALLAESYRRFWRSSTGASGRVLLALLAEWYRRFWRSGTGASSGVVPALLAEWNWHFCRSGTGASGGVVPALLAEWYWRFWRSGACASGALVLALLAEWNWRFWQKGTGAYGRKVPALLAERYRRFWRSGTGASGGVVPALLAERYCIRKHRIYFDPPAPRHPPSMGGSHNSMQGCSLR
eukprot:gene6493-7785_t